MNQMNDADLLKEDRQQIKDFGTDISKTSKRPTKHLSIIIAWNISTLNFKLQFSIRYFSTF